MPGLEFLIVVTFVGVVLLGFSGLVGWRAKNAHWNAAERSSIRLALELSMATMLLSLLPFPLFYLFELEWVVWRFASVVIILFMFIEGNKVYRQMSRYGATWPVTMISLLVLSAILLTIEVVNVLMWGSLAVYAGGLLWILCLATIQFIAFVCYDLNLVPSQNKKEDRRSDYAIHNAGGGMQRRSRTDYPNGKANGGTNIHRNAISYARSQRFAHHLPLAHDERSYRGPVSDAPFRADDDA